MGITTSASAVAQSRVDSVASLIPPAQARQAAVVLDEWVAAAGTDDEATAAQAIVDTSYTLAEREGAWGAVAEILALLLVETPDADRWTTSSGRRFNAGGRVYARTPAASSEATRIDTAAPTTAPVSGDVMERIASAVERIATVLENAEQ